MKPRRLRLTSAGALFLFLGLAAHLGSPDSAARAQGAPEGDDAPEAVRTVERPILVVPVKFRDTAAQPLLRSEAEFLRLILDPQLGADAYYRLASGNRLGFKGSEVSRAVVLPSPEEHYTVKDRPGPFGPGNPWYDHQRLVDDLGPILERTYDLHAFHSLMVFPNVPQRQGFGSAGLPLHRKKGDPRAEPLPCIYFKAAISQAGVVHEMGHLLDIGHVRTQRATVAHEGSGMAFSSDRVGHVDPRLGGLTCDHIMWHKQLLGWTTPPECRRLGAPTDEVVRLYPRSGPARGLRMLKVPLRSYGEVLTLEAVLPAGIDRAAGLPAFGVLAHRVNEARVRLANTGLFPEAYLPEAQLSPRSTVMFGEGERWSDAASQVSFRVTRVTPQWCEVHVTAPRIWEHVANRAMRAPIELETCRLEPRGGHAQIQGLKPFGADWGNDLHVWGFGNVGDGVDLTFPSATAGEREVLIGATVGPDYGSVQLKVNGKNALTLDQWAPELAISGQISLGRHLLNRGANVLSLRITGRNPKGAPDRICYGLDCLSLQD